MTVYASSSIYYLLFGTLLLPLFGTVVSSAPTSRVSLVLALVVSFGTLALKSIDIAKVALVLNQSRHSATPRSYFDRTRFTFSRRDGDQDIALRPLPVHATRVYASGAALKRLQTKVSTLVRTQPTGHHASLEQLVSWRGAARVGGQSSVGPS